MPNSGVSTVYIRNLNEKVSVNKLKSQLDFLFKERGFDVIDITAIGNVRLRGQAFITLKNSKQANLAVEVFNMMTFLNQMMDVKLSNSDSDKAREAKIKNVNLDSLRAERLARRQQRNSGNPNKRKREDGDEEPVVKRTKNLATEPNKILLLTGLPSEITEDQLMAVFKSHKGFLNLTYVSVRNLSLVEFRSERESSQCLNSLGRELVLKGQGCELEFAKK